MEWAIDKWQEVTHEMETVKKLPPIKTENEELRSMWMSNNNYSLRHDNIQGCLVDSMHISHTQN